MYSRETLVSGGYKKCIEEGGANAEKRIDKFDKKFVRPFLEDLEKLCMKYGLAIDTNQDGNLVIVDCVPSLMSRYKRAFVDIDNLKIPEENL